MAARTLPEGVRVAILADTDVVAVRRQARNLGEQLGFSLSDRTLLATAVSELARNIVQYARTGNVELMPFNHVDRVGVSIVAEDEGPGIADLTLALQDGYSTSGSLGLGLPGVKRLMDDFEIVSAPGEGTRIYACMSISSSPLGASTRPRTTAVRSAAAGTRAKRVRRSR